MRKFHTLQVCGATKLAEQLNELEKEGLSIFQVLYSIDLSKIDYANLLRRSLSFSVDTSVTTHSYTIIYYGKEEQDEVKGSA